MTPEEKAKEIFYKYRSMVWGNTMFTKNEISKKASLICIDEIIASNPEPWLGGYTEWENDYLLFPDKTHVDAKKYWQKVKEEINKLS